MDHLEPVAAAPISVEALLQFRRPSGGHLIKITTVAGFF